MFKILLQKKKFYMLSNTSNHSLKLPGEQKYQVNAFWTDDTVKLPAGI